MQLNAQESKPAFQAPLDLPLILSGNFAELRRNHFHTGLDIKTGGVEGQKIRAVAAGHVSRIAVSPTGYGKVLYIDHPSGHTSVYAHLKSFSEKIDAAARAEQYRVESFPVDFKPEPPIPVEGGEIIALSGNTGSSGGPHLHFEIRRTADQLALNPLHFGFKVMDNVAPHIRGVRFHPLTDTSLVNGSNKPQSFVVQGQNGNYRLKAGQKIDVYGAIGLSLHAHDYLDGAQNKCGIYALKLEVDSIEILRQQFDELEFARNRQINCYKDYEAYRNSSWHYHKSFLEPGNTLNIYPEIPEHRGFMHFPEKGSHHARYTTTDAHGNASVLEFSFESLDTPNGPFAAAGTYDAYFPRQQANEFHYANELHMNMPEHALYRDLKFSFGREMPSGACLSPAYQLHFDMVPLDKAIEVRIHMGSVPQRLHDRIIAARYALAGSPAWIDGKREGDFYVIQTKDLGRFCLQVDTVAPSLMANQYARGGVVNDRTVLGFVIGDDKSGIASYRTYLNGSWVLSEYEPKQRLLFLPVNNAGFEKGNNTLDIVLLDRAGNEARHSFNYSY